jgi:hypothetical protein
MRFQDHIIDETRKAADEAFKYAKATPADKLDWKPLDSGRSVLAIAQELAKCPEWAHSIVSTGKPDWSEEKMAAERAEMDAWTTIDECEAQCKKRLEKLYELYKTMGEDKLRETAWLPFDGGRDFTFQEMMDYPRWNFTWHTGQIAYIQTLFGDREMH